MITRAKKFAIIGLVLLLAMIGGSYGAYKGYKSFRQARLVRQAKEFIAQSKDRSAILCLQRALRYNPNDIEACRLMAQMHEKARSAGALLWRGKVVQLSPESLDDRLALVQAALMFNDFAAATNALNGLTPAAKQTSKYHNLAGAVASQGRMLPLAEYHFSEAARLEPTNPAPQLNLAVVRLHSTNTASAAEARTALKQLSTSGTNTTVATTALRELVGDALRSKNVREAYALSATLISHTNATFSDRVLRLEVLREANSPEFKPTLQKYQELASTNSGYTYELATWQMMRQGPSQTLAWLKTLPEDTRTNQPVCLLIADGLARAEDWTGLQDTVKNQNWGELDFVRQAFITRALRGQGLTAAAKSQWELAFKATNNQLQPMGMLLRLSALWGFDTEAEELLWAIINRYPKEKWASDALQQVLYNSGRTKPLLAFLEQRAKRDPDDLTVKNNLATLALLLNQTELKPHDVALDVYTKSPTNSAFASTYAFSLYLQGKPQEGLKVMQRISVKELENPAIAGYYGLLLKAAGDNARARTYLDWSSRAQLLKEERSLFERAKAGT